MNGHSRSIRAFRDINLSVLKTKPDRTWSGFLFAVTQRYDADKLLVMHKLLPFFLPGMFRRSLFISRFLVGGRCGGECRRYRDRDIAGVFHSDTAAVREKNLLEEFLLFWRCHKRYSFAFFSCPCRSADAVRVRIDVFRDLKIIDVRNIVD